MKTPTIILNLMILFSSFVYGQNLQKKDSLEIKKAIQKVFQNFENPNFNEFENISTTKIYCLICDGTIDSKLGPYVLNRKDFFENHMEDITNSQNWQRATKSMELKLHQEKNKNIDITAYLTTWKKDEWAKGHEGAQLGLYFKKTKEKYLFAGIETMP